MKWIYIFLSLLIFTACSNKTMHITPANEQNLEEEKEVQSHFVKLQLKQDISILPEFKEEFIIDSKRYKDKFFSPWHIKTTKFKIENIFWSFKGYLNPNKKYYFFNKQTIPKNFFKACIENANTKNFLRVNKKALVIRNSLLKNLPTDETILLNPFRDSEGIPFDYAQDSVLNIASAVLISHFSKDKKYAFVLAETGWGFVLAENLEIFDDERAKTYESLHFITPLKEKTSVYDVNNNFLFETRIGALYPYYSSDKKYFFGKIGKIKYKIPKKEVAIFPLKLNDKNIKHQISELLELPYGWGGYAFQRDCSLLIRDIFAPFGIYLPRNSYAQSKSVANFDISFLNNKEKKELLKNFAKAYQTLVYLKGHIMLYTGTINNKNTTFHSIWGLKTKDNGRLLISKSAITTIDIGENDSRINHNDLILSRIVTISFLNLSDLEKQNLKEFLNQKKK